MVVDDSDDIRAMLKLVLDLRGYRVVEAANGQEAVEVAQTTRPDLVLMDLSMPVLDGFGAARALRAIDALCAAPIVAISAHNTSDHRAKALAVGFNDYLTKPIDFSQLVMVVGRLLEIA